MSECPWCHTLDSVVMDWRGTGALSYASTGGPNVPSAAPRMSPRWHCTRLNCGWVEK